MSSNEPKSNRLQSIENSINELKKSREEGHKNIEKSLQEYQKDREDFYKKFSEQISGLKKTI